MKAFLTILTVLLLPVFAVAQLAQVPRPTIDISGDAVVYVAPDKIVVSLGIELFDPLLQKVQASLDDAGHKLLGAVKQNGVEEKNIQTDVASVSIIYENGNDNRRAHVVAGYLARRMYSITLTDVKQLEPLINAALSNGANLLNGVDYQSTELRKHRDVARRMAIKAAKEKAILLTEEVGMAVGNPTQISEGSFSLGFTGYNRNGNFNSVAQNAFAQAPAPAGGDGDSTLPVGQIAIRAQVSVTFEMMPAK